MQSFQEGFNNSNNSSFNLSKHLHFLRKVETSGSHFRSDYKLPVDDDPDSVIFNINMMGVG